MKILRTALALAGASALVVGAMAAPALADTNVPIYGGTTTITVTSTALPKVTGAGIIMWGTDGASSSYVTQPGEARQQFNFDVTTPSNLMLEDDVITGKVGSITGGKVVHLGGIEFLNTNNGKQATVGDFVVNFGKMKVFTTKVNGDPVDATAVFNLVPANTPLYPVYDDNVSPTTATVSGVTLTLTKSGAGTLNDLLKTGFFDNGFKFGKVSTVANLVEVAK